LWDTIERLYAQRVVLEYTDHLDDRQLYALILRDILPSMEKKIESPPRFLHWDCADASGDVDVWLRYYASDAERRVWAQENRRPLPPSETPRFRRKMPSAPR
jgi:hypothetical protein